MKAIEAEGTVEQGRRVVLDTPLPPSVSGRVRVIILVGDEAEEASDHEWLKAAARGGGLEFLSAPEEGLYTLSDGKPFDDAR
jgi:hypothetical protein